MPPIEGIAVAGAIICLLLSLFFFFSWRAAQQEQNEQVALWTGRYRRSNDLCHDEMDRLKNRDTTTIHALQTELARCQAENDRLTEAVDMLENDLEESGVYYSQQDLLDWFDNLTRATYRNRLEVNTRFVYRLLQNLGYPDAALQQDVPANIQADTINVRGHLDWLVHNMNGGNLGNACFAVRTIEPGSVIDDLVVSQVRSCAFAQDVPFFVVTDGTQIKVYETKERQRDSVMESPAATLPNEWDDLVDELGFGNVDDDE